jgi:hypothetical protein
MSQTNNNNAKSKTKRRKESKKFKQHWLLNNR